MSEYLMLLHEPTGGFDQVSPEEMQAIIQKYHSWTVRLQESGKVQLGKKLKDSVRSVARSNGQVVVDGPFSETKEVIGGLFLIQAADEEEALEICRGCPHLEFGRIELRAVDVVE